MAGDHRFNSLSPRPLCSSLTSVVNPFSSWSGTMRSRTTTFARLVLLWATPVFPSLAQDKPMQMPTGEMHHHHGDILVVQPVYPRLGRAQENPSTPLFTLEEAQRLATENNP